MKKLIVLLLCLLYWGAYAQKTPEMDPKSREEMMKKIEVARIAMITERLNLKPEQAEKFWPVYREYTDQRRAILENLRDLKRQSDEGKNEEESKVLVERAYALKQQELSLEKNYTERMMKIISAQQFMSLRRAEDDFRRELLQRLEKRREDQMQRLEMRDKREEFQKEKRGN